MGRPLGGHGFDNGKVAVGHATPKTLGLGHDTGEVQQDSGLKAAGLGGGLAVPNAGQDGVIAVQFLKVLKVLQEALAGAKQGSEAVGRLVAALKRDIGYAVLAG